MRLTKRLILSFMIIGLSAAGSGLGRTAAAEDERPDAEEYAAYSALITALVKERRPAAKLVVINHRTTGIREPHQLSGMSLTETYESFKARGVDSYRLDRRFDLKIEYVLASEEEGWKLFPDAFAARYSQGFGTLLLSRAGLNREKTEVLIYVLERQGFYARADGYTLRKTEGEWRVSRRRFLWVT
ncbi:MAG TPA: hypothetical protein VK421_09835 [Pyrinomonadaceae bacterium]|nr:hypothetical protein [Pyrinomonadaceae bacterium]